MKTPSYSPIGIFDSGYGGLTVYREISKLLPQYDYLYLGDNARTPYGTRSFETIYEYTWECVQALFARGCHLVILACNTASAKALRVIQQKQLPQLPQGKKVLGVLRPTTELAGSFTKTGHIGIMATPGTVASASYTIEINKFFPAIKVYQQACPMWVPLVENNEHLSEGSDYFVQKYAQELLAQSGDIDAVLLACTHYPLLQEKIKEAFPKEVNIISQGGLVAKSLAGYLQRHPEIEAKCSKGGQELFFTTDYPLIFDNKAAMFLGRGVASHHLHL